jgi:small-conductance mechanosensitive channel
MAGQGMSQRIARWQRLFIQLLLIPLLLCSIGVAADAAAPVASPSPKSLPSTLADLPSRSRSTQEVLGRVSAHLSEAQTLLGDRALFQLQEKITPKVTPTSPTRRFIEADLALLMDMDAELSSHSLQLNQFIEKYQATTRKFDADSLEIEAELAGWQMLEGMARARTVPEEVFALIMNAERLLSEGAERIHPIRNNVLIALTKAIESRSVLDHLDAEIASRRQAIGRELLDEDREPLWALSGPNKTRFQNALKALGTWTHAISQHLTVHAGELILMVMALGAMSWFLGERGQRLLSQEVAFSTMARGAIAIANQRFWLALLTILLGLNLGPKGPIAFYDGLWLLILVPVTLLAHTLDGSFRWLTIYAVAFALIPFPFRTILEPMPWVDRWLLNFQATLVASALLHDLFRGREDWPFKLKKSLVSSLVMGLSAFLLIGVGANMMGRTGLAKELVDGLIASLGFLLVYSVAKDVAFLYVAGLIESPIGKLLRTASSDPRSLLYGAYRLLLTLTVVMVVWGSLNAFRLEALAMSWGKAVWETSLHLGRVDFPLKAILTALVIAGVTLFSLRLTRFVLERELLPRFRLSAGVPFAITTLSQYAVAVLGFVLAMTSLGIDLTQISILAGAVGVGVGFGLQNIFNNFISGLILLFERPIHVGDIIEVGTLRGTVTRIGIRSSTIRTPTGAEVLMPNGDLIAKEVINWTLSDRRRRLEINVSAAYGTSIPKVLELLMELAASSKEVLEDPAPLAVFSNFGESSLDFVLYAWVERYEDTVLVASHLRQIINERFQEEGVVIPYPQRDIHFTPSKGITLG